MQGIIFEIERWSTRDGPGIRTVIFFKGCPLRCLWCSNPESQIKEPQIAIYPEKCLNCLKCVEACPNNAAIPAIEGGFRENAICNKCGRCVNVCPSSARQLIGKYMDIDEVIDEIKKDYAFYRRSGGGVTFTGGSPLYQPMFLMGLVKECKLLGIHTAIETCGYFNWFKNRDNIKKIDFVFIDIKHIDNEIHRKYTGVSNEIILENAKNISNEKIPIVVRIPVIPTINDAAENIESTALFVKKNLDSALGIELLPYHDLGKGKYRALGLKYEIEDIKPPSNNQIEMMKEIISNCGVRNVKF